MNKGGGGEGEERTHEKTRPSQDRGRRWSYTVRERASLSQQPLKAARGQSEPLHWSLGDTSEPSMASRERIPLVSSHSDVTVLCNFGSLHRGKGVDWQGLSFLSRVPLIVSEMKHILS